MTADKSTISQTSESDVINYVNTEAVFTHVHIQMSAKYVNLPYRTFHCVVGVYL